MFDERLASKFDQNTFAANNANSGSVNKQHKRNFFKLSRIA